MESNSDILWRGVIEKALPAILVLNVATTTAFENNKRSCSTATGFIIDKDEGFILTNRHVIYGGPGLQYVFSLLVLYFNK